MSCKGESFGISMGIFIEVLREDWEKFTAEKVGS